jgi:hypothetical protein
MRGPPIRSLFDRLRRNEPLKKTRDRRRQATRRAGTNLAITTAVLLLLGKEEEGIARHGPETGITGDHRDHSAGDDRAADVK